MSLNDQSLVEKCGLAANKFVQRGKAPPSTVSAQTITATPSGRINDMGEVKGKKGSRRDLTSCRKSTFMIKSKV
jgi:hypothetical protein